MDAGVRLCTSDRGKFLGLAYLGEVLSVQTGRRVLGFPSDLPFGPSHDGNVKTAIEAAESPAMESMIFKYDFLLFIVQF